MAGARLFSFEDGLMTYAQRMAKVAAKQYEKRKEWGL